MNSSSRIILSNGMEISKMPYAILLAMRMEEEWVVAEITVENETVIFLAMTNRTPMLKLAKILNKAILIEKEIYEVINQF